MQRDENSERLKATLADLRDAQRRVEELRRDVKRLVAAEAVHVSLLGASPSAERREAL